jgi:general secretion pathway protein G
MYLILKYSSRAAASPRRACNGQSGFSILELLLVLVILSILAGIVGVRFAGQSGKAKVRAAAVQLTNLETALKSYEIELGRFPTTQQGLEALYEAPSNLDDWDGPYLDKRVEDDPWGNAWQYRSPGTNNADFDLWSIGPDGREGGDDDVVNWTDDD